MRCLTLKTAKKAILKEKSLIVIHFNNMLENNLVRSKGFEMKAPLEPVYCARAVLFAGVLLERIWHLNKPLEVRHHGSRNQHTVSNQFAPQISTSGTDLPCM
jgi:hypothetical protein